MIEIDTESKKGGGYRIDIDTESKRGETDKW